MKFLVLWPLLAFTLSAFAQSQDCVKIRDSILEQPKSLNLVFVPSGFNDNLDLFEAKIREHWTTVSQYEPFSTSVDSLNVWIAKVPHKSNSYCSFNSKITRLLDCNSSKAVSQAKKCVPADKNRHVIVIHNSDVYGGSGGRVATATNNILSAKIIVHELGHSIFKLADEYVDKTGFSDGPNCAQKSTNCSAWQDLIDAGLATCEEGCPENKRFTSEKSVMRALSEPGFGHMNQRYICCEYKKMTGKYPQFCEQYQAIGVGLDKFCE